MEKIKLLIADDEDDVRNAVCRMIKWDAENITVCASARNGKEAYDKIHETGADVALLDIRMPIMTGLQVASELKKEGSKVKIIILSGYDDFNYAKEALLNGAVNYLLKPCRPDHILSAVREARDQVLKERVKELADKELSITLEDNKYDIKNKWISDLILTTNSTMFQEISRRFEWEASGRIFCFVIQPPEKVLFFKKQQQSMISYLEENLECAAGCVAENIVAVVNENAAVDKKKFRDILMRLKKMVLNQYGISISIGVGDMMPVKEGLKRSYQNAMKALDMIYFLGTDFIIFYDSIYANQNENYPSQIEAQVLEAIKQQNVKECADKVDEFFQASMEENGGGGIIKNAIAILLSLYHYSMVSGLSADRIFGQPTEVMEYVQRSRTREEVSEKIKKQCRLVIKQMGSNVTENRFVNAAILYIKQNYFRDITLSNVADEVFITAGYLSTLFKQVTGESFVNYLNQVRIEHACELLKDVRLKTYEVAYQVGFQDEKYFTKVFKKRMGVSPSQYRKDE